MISELLNKVFHTGVYPQIWKLAHITPIFKAKQKCDKANYRPISLLPTLSKICESVLHKRLIDHLLTNNIITKFQAAYIPNDSTSQQLINMIHHIKLAMASNKIAHGVFLDVSAAFDAVWHSGLLRKLEQINIKGDALKLFSSYLSMRRAVTVIDGKKSTEQPVNAGVPQGSRLGPLLFLVYMNVEKPDLTLVFYTDIAASCGPVYANQTWSFLHMILSTGPQPLVYLRTSSIYCALSICSIHFMCIDLLPFHIEIEHLCHTDCFAAFILSMDIETSLCSL